MRPRRHSEIEDLQKAGLPASITAVRPPCQVEGHPSISNWLKPFWGLVAAGANPATVGGGVHLPLQGYTSLTCTCRTTNLCCPFLDCGRNPEKTHEYMGPTCKPHTDRCQWGFEPGLLAVRECATVPHGGSHLSSFVQTGVWTVTIGP